MKPTPLLCLSVLFVSFLQDDKKPTSCLTASGRQEDKRIDCQRKAADVTCKGLIEAMKKVKKGITEKDLQKIIEDVYEKENGNRELSFPTIVAAGDHATSKAAGDYLHHKPCDKVLADGELVKCDTACKFEGWACDITRTFPVNGKFTEEQRKIYEIVLGTQKEGEKEIKAGSSFTAVEGAAKNYMKEKTKEVLGNEYRTPHAYCHFTGKTVHGGMPKGFGNRGKLKAGDIHVIEPGIYLKDKGIGIRIEDIYLVTEDGFERLSRHVPREVDEIEKLMAEAKKEGKQENKEE